MKFQYKVSLFLLLLSQTIFFILVVYHNDFQIYYPEGQPDTEISIGYSWIWYHLEHWIVSLVLVFIALVLFIHGLISEFMEFRGKRSKFIESGVSTKRKWLYVFLLVIIWISIIFLSLYFAGVFNQT